jgi:hypothetical protein
VGQTQVINAEWIEVSFTLSHNLYITDIPLLQCPGLWPPHIESSLKKLMILHGLYAYPETDHENEAKIWRIFVELRTSVELRGWDPSIHDERLWGTMQMKLGSVRAQMLRNWEVYKSEKGYKLSSQTITSPRTRMPMAREPLIPYPRAPILGRYRCFEALETWKSIDADNQIKLFRKQIRSAKDPKRLTYEWGQFCGELCRKELNGVIEADESNRSAKKKNPSYLKQGRRPPATPQPDVIPIESKPMESKPTESKPIESKLKDLKTILEDRIREVKCKRELNKRELAEQDERDEFGGRKRARR